MLFCVIFKVVCLFEYIDNATWKDVFVRIRADESNHRDVNHKLAEIANKPKAFNPFRNKDKE